MLSDYGNKDQKTQIGENSKGKDAENNISNSNFVVNGSKRDKNDILSSSGAIIDSQLDMPSLSTSKTENGDIGITFQIVGIYLT